VGNGATWLLDSVEEREPELELELDELELLELELELDEGACPEGFPAFVSSLPACALGATGPGGAA